MKFSINHFLLTFPMHGLKNILGLFELFTELENLDFL